MEKEAETGAHSRRCRRHACRPERRDQRNPQGPHRRQRIGRASLRRAEALFARPDRGGREGQARSGDRPRRGNSPHDPGAVPPDQEQSGADRRARRRQDRHRRGPGAAHHQRRRARELEGQEAPGARHGRADRRREISRRVRGAAQGRAAGDHRGGRRHHSVHRRDAHAGRRRQGRGLDGCLQPAEAGSGARRAALRRRDHARRISQACREGRGARPPLPAGLRFRAERGGHDFDPARPEGEIRAASRRAHHRQRAGRRGDAFQPLHHRPLSPRQGHRPGGRSREPPADAGGLQAGGARRARPPADPAQDRARGAEEGERSGLQGPAEPAAKGDCRAGGEIRRAHPPLAG